MHSGDVGRGNFLRYVGFILFHIDMFIVQQQPVVVETKFGEKIDKSKVLDAFVARGTQEYIKFTYCIED